jgi:hypothetical protein
MLNPKTCKGLFTYASPFEQRSVSHGLVPNRLSYSTSEQQHYTQHENRNLS